MINDRDYLSQTQLLPSAPGAPPLMQIVNTPRPIEWLTLDAYAARAGLAGEDYQLFLRVLRALDDEYLKVKAELAAGISDDDDDDDDDTED